MKTKPWLLAALLAAALQSPVQAKEPQTYQLAPVSVAQPSQSGPGNLTIEQAMAHPDWLQRAVENVFFSADGSTLYYQQKREGSEIRDWYSQQAAAGSVAQLVPMANWHQLGSAGLITSPDGQSKAWTFEGNVFVLKQGQLSQVTRSSTAAEDLMFLADNRLAFRQGWTYQVLDLTSGALTELVSLKNADAPKAPQVAHDYKAQEQHKLIQFIALEHQNAKDKFEQQQLLAKQNSTLAPKAVYLNKDKRVARAVLSPKADKMLVALADKSSWRDEQDIMPNYITASGNIAAEQVRRRVADQKPQSQQLMLVELATGEVTELKYDSLPGFDEDVLASVKAENAKAEGKKYESKKAPRAISLLNDWSWANRAIQWHPNGEQVAVMLKAWDNKDRWLATVDFATKKLVSQHRLHDDAWVNYSFNDFGWLHNETSLYYLSEESGYAHLYVKALNGKAKKLTAGTFEVSSPVLSKNDEFVYFKGNVSHPGIYEVYRVGLKSGQLEQMTALKGSADFQLSPDESKLLLTWSNSVTPPELYLMDNKPKAAASRLTNTTTTAFKAMNWAAPQVVAVPSSHGKQPVFAKLYLPNNYQQGEKRRAVIFNHGAGYLQNSDLGWSGYFREYFFHNLLLQKGYVVLDMDYRASKGYGRDWRTAIYRQMGTPEIQDLMDGVEYLVKHANVDRARIGTYGGSYGGFMTFMALFTQPDLFKAGAALRPVSDWAYYNHPYTSNILNTPDVDPIAYRRSSPIYFTEGLKSKLLINAPMVDDNVFFQDVVRVVQRLIEHENANFETAIYPVEPHGFRQPSSWLDEYKRILKLFEETL
ncbi:prolyl oligopeptidase family serine peptidase [Rheinheimera sp.]|uniref:S9 family peptidase n=1 Tax=Rheinheimera sp. TaxID=1869214 RepID=UPI00307ED0C9